MENEETLSMTEITGAIELSSNNLSPLRNNDGDKNYIHAATSNNTRKAYQADMRHFVLWGGCLPEYIEASERFSDNAATTILKEMVEK